VYARVSAGTVTFDEVKNAIAAATSAGGQFYKGMEKASQTTAGRIATLKDNATALVGEVFEPISEGLSGKLLPAAIDAVDELSAAFRENGVNGMVAAAGDIVGETIAGFALSLPDFVNTAVSIVDSLMQGIKDNLVTISNGASSAVLTLADGIIDLLPELIVTGTLLIGKLAAGVIKGLPDLVAQIPSMIEEIVSGFAKHGGEWKQIGHDIVNGIWDSLKIYWKNFTDWFDGAWEDLVSGVKDLLGIHSPSRVFGNIGKNMALGAEDGWFNTFGGIKRDIQNSMNFDAGFVTMRPSMAPAMATVGGGSAVSYGGFTFNIYAQPGQDADAIADAVMDRIQTEVERKGAAW
jgi:phage-related protein